MASWLIVLGERTQLDWVVAHKVMGFRDHIKVDSVRKGDRFAMYVTRGAYHNPTSDSSRIFAIGTITTRPSQEPLDIDGEPFKQSVRLKFDRPPLAARRGMLFKPLVHDLSFVKKPEAWFNYVRRALVAIPDSDLELIDDRLRQYEDEEHRPS